MKVITFIAIAFSFNLYSKISYPNYVGSTKRMESFFKKLKTSIQNKDKLVTHFTYPFKLDLETGRSIVIKDQFEFKENYKELLKAGLKKAIVELDISKIEISNYQGVMINNIWFDAKEENGAIFIKSINQIFEDIKSIPSIQYDEIKALSRVEKDKVIVKYNVKEHSGGEYKLYKADVNNDGQEEYIHIYLNSGSGKYSGINRVFKVKSGKIKYIDLSSLQVLGKVKLVGVHRSKRAYTWKSKGKIKLKNFYSQLGNPFLFKKKNKVYMNFSENKVNISYAWVENSLKEI